MIGQAVPVSVAAVAAHVQTGDDSPVADIVQPFRRAMRRHASGVCVVTLGAGSDANGMAVTAATSFSLAPPSILVCLNQAASITPRLREGVAFGLTILGRAHEQVAAAFSRKPSGPSRFSTGAWLTPCGEPPYLADAPANVACVVAGMMAYGTHVALIGRVVSVRLGPQTQSLVFRDGTYG